MIGLSLNFSFYWNSIWFPSQDYVIIPSYLITTTTTIFKKRKKRMNSDFNYFLAYFSSLNIADYFLRKLESRWKEKEAFFSFWFTFFAKGHHQIFLWKIWTSGTKCLMNFHVKKSQKLMILSLCFNFLHEKSKFRESYIHHIKGGKCNNQKLAANSFPFDRSHEVHSWQMSRCFLHAPHAPFRIQSI